MIWLLHGKNILKIQKNLQNIVSNGKYDEKIDISGEDCDLQYFSEIVCTPSIFSQKIVVTTSLEKISDEDILKYIETSTRGAKTTDVIFYTSKTLSGKNKVLEAIKVIKTAKIIEVKEDKDWTVFNFADAVFEKNKEKAYKLLQELETKEDPIKVHAILSNHLRNIAKINLGAELKIAPFIQTKLQKQASKFTKNDILKMYQYFYETDKNLKTGKTSENLANLLEMERVFETSKKDDEKESIHKR
jgi:DNA polymerase III delta subunit